MFAWIRQSLAAPVFKDEDKTRLAGLLNAILLTLLALSVMYGFASLFIYPDPVPVLVFIGVVILLALGTLSLMRRGRVQFASVLLSFVLWVIVSVGMFVFGGVRSPSFSSYFIVILIAGLLLGGRAGIAFAGLSIVAGLGILYAEIGGVLPCSLVPITSAFMWLPVAAVLFLGAAVLLHIATGSINAALGRARRNERALAESNRELQREITERVRAEEALQQRNRELSLLHQTSRALNSTLDLDQVLATLLEGVRCLLNVVACSAWLIDPETNELVCRQFTGRRAEIVRGWRLAPGEGLAGWVARSGESLIVPDARADERHFRGIAQQTGLEMRSILSVPLKVKEKIIGVLQVVDKEIGRFDTADLEWVEALAASATSAIENARLYKESELYADRLQYLHEIDQAILSAQSPQAIAQATLHHIRRLVPYQWGDVSVFHFESGEAMAFATYFEGETGLEGSARLFSKVFGIAEEPEQGKVHVVEDILALSQPTPADQALQDAGVRSYINMPLVSQNELIGSLNLGADRPAAFAPQHIDIAREVSNSLAVAIRQARLHEQAQRRLGELTAIHQAGQRLQRLHTPETLAQEISGILDDTLDYAFGGVALIDEPTGRLIPFGLSEQSRVSAVIEAEKARIISHGLHLGEGITGWVALTGQSLRVGDVRQDPRYCALRDDIRSELCVPLRTGEHVMGVVNVEDTAVNAYTEADQRVLETVASQMAVAIQNARLYEQVRAGRERLRQLAQQVVSAREEERRRLSRELHDEAGQALTVLRINLELMQADFPVGAVSLRQRMAKVVALTNTTMEQIRLLAQNLRPPALDALGLNRTLEGFCHDFAARTQLSIEYRGADLPELSDTVNISLYRFLQEALTNVAKHANANRVRVFLSCDAETVSLSVEDDGQGFDEEILSSVSSRPTGIGLLGMQERLKLLGGWLKIEFHPGQGTLLVAHIPLKETI